LKPTSSNTLRSSFGSSTNLKSSFGSSSFGPSTLKSSFGSSSFGSSSTTLKPLSSSQEMRKSLKKLGSGYASKFNKENIRNFSEKKVSIKKPKKKNIDEESFEKLNLQLKE